MDIEFKLFGSLTVRQFSYVAVTFILAVVLYVSPLARVISLPLVILTIVIGLGMAFLTVNEMPFADWFGLFVTNLFTSQRKVYKKIGGAATVFSSNSSASIIKASNGATAAELKQRRKEQLIEQLRTSSPNPDLDTLQPAAQIGANSVGAGQDRDSGLEDPLADDQLARLENYFTGAANSELQQYGLGTMDDNMAGRPAPAGAFSAPGSAQGHVEELKGAQYSAQRTLNSATGIDETPPGAHRAPGNAQPQSQIKITETPPSSNAPSIQRDSSSDSGPNPDLGKSRAESVSKADKNQEARGTNGLREVKTAEQLPVVAQKQTQPVAEVTEVEVNTIQRLRPNQISGIVTSPSGEIMAGAKIQIKESESGELKRMVHTNGQGRFLIPSQLPDGKYKLEISSGKAKFPQFELELTGSEVPVYNYQAQS